MEKRFVKVYSDGMMNISEIWVDIKTGVNYFYHASGNSGGLTPRLSSLHPESTDFQINSPVSGTLPAPDLAVS